MKEIGELLKKKRESLNVTLEEVSSVTKINIKSLQAIEDGDLDRLPAKTFVRGFVQTYAKYLGLDVAEIIAKLQETLGSTKPKPQTTHSDETTTMRKPLNIDLAGSGKNIVTIGAIVLTIIAIAIIQRIVSRHEAELKTTEVQAITGSDTPVTIKAAPPAPVATETPTPVPEVIPTPKVEKPVEKKEEPKPTPTPKPSPTPSPTPKPTPTPSPKVEPTPTPSATPVEAEVPQEIIIEALDNVTVKVSLDGKTAQEVNMAADQIQTFKAKGKIKLSTPNGGAINIIHNGKEVGVPGNLGQPKTMNFPQ